MLVVPIIGGLGNQMYGYALYRTLLERGRDVYMDISFYNHQNNPLIDFREYELSRVFNITERLFNRKSLKFFMLRVLRKLHLGFKGYTEKGYYYQPEVFDVKSGFFNGYWQSFKYSAEIENILRKEFTFKIVPTGEAAELLDKVRNCNSVSMSIRRGDYVKLSHIHKVLHVDYYINAIRYIQERVSNAKFFCTSDDINWCENTYGGRGYDIHFVKCPSDNNSYDMQLISQCKHNIIANSTFSIWGAWLNQNPEKIVIRPEKFFSDGGPCSEHKDLWPEDWISIPS